MSGVDLVQWFGEQLAEDERIAQSTGGMAWLEFAEGGWVETAPPSKTEWKGPGDDGRHVASVRLAEDRAHIAEHDPARVLRETDAKRRMVEECERAMDEDSRGMTSMANSFLRLLALPYEDRPGYKEAWRP